jgi:hypothetical protein
MKILPDQLPDFIIWLFPAIKLYYALPVSLTTSYLTEDEFLFFLITFEPAN